ncbi:acetyl-CoA carboxylase biotin carboxyl carrier protein subunit [Oenococcus sp. UCMA 16435]|nr:acetyl-CoA carboxylase biotin carboxyl carrier protein subunit [Oenococcus sp. UCMA 16435]MDI4583523.1 biotin/lipoyl-binding protein [Oenococcus sp. UCMA 14587]MDN6967718.1 acetyl-CoA carboxylase biotin carboxyl carrier protein subunit [Oenococcus sp. UCMA 17063]
MKGQRSIRILAPVAGKITDIQVNQKDRVNAGDIVGTLSVNDVQNDILSETTGVVSSINVSVGDQVIATDTLFEIASDE